jgi:hypothetical protein
MLGQLGAALAVARAAGIGPGLQVDEPGSEIHHGGRPDDLVEPLVDAGNDRAGQGHPGPQAYLAVGEGGDLEGMIHAAGPGSVNPGRLGHVGGGLHEALGQAGLLGLRAPGLALLEAKHPATGKPKPDER